MTVKINRLFFDKPAVTRATERAERRVLVQFGAFVRTAARRSIRRRKAASKPGKPPTNRTGLLKQFIFFSYSITTGNVVIGPELINSRSNYANTTVPRLLEEGGSVTVVRRGERKKISIKPRPYMGPAFAKGLDKAPSMFKNSISSIK